jgi:hypothetical protein
MEITETEKGVLLFAARESIRRILDLPAGQAGQTPHTQIDYRQYPFLKLHLGAFVTLKIETALRGCTGYILTKATLYDTVCEAAKQAAFSDPRFFPLTQEEFGKIKIEISILSSPQRIKEYDEIIIGKHGVILDEGYVRAVLLPQVAVANNYLREQFLSALCEKGGLLPNTWKIQKLNLQVFTATIISENVKNE